MKIIQNGLIIILIWALGVFCGFPFGITIEDNFIDENLYLLSAEVTSIEPYGQLIVVCDSKGNEFAFHDNIDMWQVGDKCMLLMDNKNTETVSDDEIVKTQHEFSKTP